MRQSASLRRTKISSLSKLASIGKHNERDIDENKIDYLESCIEREYTKDNIILIGNEDNTLTEDFKEVFDNTFRQDLELYNSRQKRKDRRIDDYLKHLSERDRVGIGSEVILQFGDSELWSKFNQEEKKELGKSIAEEQVKIFKELNKNFVIARATLHLDETSPHLHIVGFNVRENCKQGLKRQAVSYLVVKKEELSEMHQVFKEKSLESVKKIFKEKNINIDLEQKEKGKSRKHLTIKEYKEKRENLEKDFESIEKKLKPMEEKKLKKFLGFIGKEKVSLSKEEFESIKNLMSDLEQHKLSDTFEDIKENIERVSQDNTDLINKNNELSLELERLIDNKNQVTKELEEIKEQNQIMKNFIATRQINSNLINNNISLLNEIDKNKNLLKEMNNYNANKSSLNLELESLRDKIIEESKGKEKLEKEVILLKDTALIIKEDKEFKENLKQYGYEEIKDISVVNKEIKTKNKEECINSISKNIGNQLANAIKEQLKEKGFEVINKLINNLSSLGLDIKTNNIIKNNAERLKHIDNNNAWGNHFERQKRNSNELGRG